MNFLNRVIVITGASSGIGRQLAEGFAARGAIVVGCGRSIIKLKEALKEVRRTSPRSTMIGCDVSDAEQVRGMVKKILADYGQIDILVNNAGIGMRKAFIETSLETVEQLMRTNYLGAVYCTHGGESSSIIRIFEPMMKIPRRTRLIAITQKRSESALASGCSTRRVPSTIRSGSTISTKLACDITGARRIKRTTATPSVIFAPATCSPFARRLSFR